MARLIDADALKAKAFGDRKGLIHTADVDAVPEAIVRCCECKNWEQCGGLTCGACKEYGAFTSQFEFCSRGNKRCD